MFRYLPEQASEHAPSVDWIHHLVTDLSIFFTIAIVGAMIYFAIRYRKRDGKDHETPRIESSHTLEMIWTIVPTIVCVYIAYHGTVIFQEMRAVPKDALTINVWGQKWQWNFEYENGKKFGGKGAQFVVPVNKPVKLVMQSRDVIHSFFIPAMRVKNDVVPGRYSYVTFKAVKEGEYPVFCTEYCGLEHSAMLASVKVVSASEYERWVNDRSEELALNALSPAQRGGKLYLEKGCNACHSLDGVRGVGPSFLKIWGKEEKLTDGSTALVDENYIRESILNPAKKVVEGYAPVMVSYEGQVTDDEITSLIAFIKSQDGTQAPVVAPKKDEMPAEDWSALTPVERGKRWYTAKAVPACMTCHSLDGSKLVGPSFKGIWGRDEALEDGTTVKVDEAYIIESVLNPMAKITKGYPPAMPPYQGQLKEEDIKDIIEYLKTLGN